MQEDSVYHFPLWLTYWQNSEEVKKRMIDYLESKDKSLHWEISYYYFDRTAFFHCNNLYGYRVPFDDIEKFFIVEKGLIPKNNGLCIKVKKLSLSKFGQSSLDQVYHSTVNIMNKGR